METIYNLTKEECKTLCKNYDTDKLALILWNKGIVKSLNSGIKRAIKIKNFAQ